MTKAEMEHHNARYNALAEDARGALSEGLYQRAVEKAMESWQHVDGMMQYVRKYVDKSGFASVETIDIVLEYAPLLLDWKTLDSLEGLLKELPRIEKHTTHDLSGKLNASRALLRDAHRLWDALESSHELRQDKLSSLLGGDQRNWPKIAEHWETIGVLQRAPEGNSFRLSLVTRLNRVVAGKCSACGHRDEAPKAMFLEELKCPACGDRAIFVILS